VEGVAAPIFGWERQRSLSRGSSGPKVLRLLDAWFYLERGDARGIPAAAEGFHELHAGDEPLAIELRRETFVGEQRLLRGDHIQIVDESAGVAVRGDIERFSSIGDGGGLCFFGLVQNGEAGEAIFDFAKRIQDGAAIRRDRALVTAC